MTEGAVRGQRWSGWGICTIWGPDRRAETEGRAWKPRLRGQAAPGLQGVWCEHQTVENESGRNWNQAMETLGWLENERPCREGMRRQGRR